MAISTFTAGQLLTNVDLNNAFQSCLDLTDTSAQTMAGALNLTSVNAQISVATQDLITSGVVQFNGPTGIHIGAGSTITRPRSPSFGDIHCNTDSGLFEVYLANGSWANLQTTAAATGPSNPPINPSAISFGQASSTSVPLAWTAPGGGTGPFGYTVNFRLSGTSAWTQWATNITTLQSTVSGLLPATRYDFQVVTYNAAGQASSPIASTNTLGYLAGGPSSISASSPTSTTVSLAWSTVQATSPVAYAINYAPVGANAWVTFGTPVSGTSVVVTGLNPNQTYNFQVVARTLGGSYESGVTQATTTVAATSAPAAPTNLQFANVTTSSVDVSWTAPTSGTAPFAYAVQHQINGGQYITYATTTATQITMSNLTSGQTYYVRIQAINSYSSSTSTASPVTPTTAVASSGSVAEFQTSGATYPIISGPQIGSIPMSSTLAITGINVDDPAAAYSPGTMSVSATCSGGTLTMVDSSNNKIGGSGTATIPATPMTLGSVKAALASLSYTAGATAGGDTITVTVADQFAQTSKILINITIQAGSSGSSGGSLPPSGTPTGGSSTATGQPTDQAGTLAGRLNDLYSHFGIGVSYESAAYGPGFQTTTAAVLENMLNYIAVGRLRYLRAKVGAGIANSAETQFMSMVAQNCGGARYIIEPDISKLPPSQWQSILNNIVQYCTNFPQYTSAVTGILNSSGSPDVVASIQQFQPTIYSAISSAGYPVYSPPGLAAKPYADYGFMSDLWPSAPDLDAIQTSYSLNGNTTNSRIAGNVVSASGFGNKQAGGLIEFTYNTFADGSPPVAAAGYVAETVQAEYLLLALLRGYQLSTSVPGSNTPASLGTLIYSDLIDNGTTSGLYNNFTGTPRLAGRLLNWIFTNIYDTNVNAFNFTPGRLNYTVTGKPSAPPSWTNAGYGDAVFQIYGGSYIVAMWNEQFLNNPSTNASLNVSGTPVTFHLNERVASAIYVYDPIVGASGGNALLASATGANSVSFNLPAYPVFVVAIP